MAVEIRGLDELGRKVENFGKKAPNLDRDIVQKVALSAKGILLSEAGSDTGGDLKLSRFARGRGRALRVSFNVKQSRERGASALVQPVPPGPWYLLEKGGKQHMIKARRRGRFLGQPGKFAATGPVQHPGSPAKRTWSRGETKAIAAGRQLFHRSAGNAYMNLWR